MNNEELQLLDLGRHVEGVLDTKEKVLQFEEEMFLENERIRQAWCLINETEDVTMERPFVSVTLCIRRNGKVLAAIRKTKHASGLWGFPGGHLEQYEDFEEAALREMREEAGPDIKVKDVRYWTVANTKFPDEGKHYVVVFMLADWISGEAQEMEPDKNGKWEWYTWDDLPTPLMPGTQDLKNRGLHPYN